jgi:hypothetical protein
MEAPVEKPQAAFSTLRNVTVATPAQGNVQPRRVDNRAALSTMEAPGGKAAGRVFQPAQSFEAA